MIDYFFKNNKQVIIFLLIGGINAIFCMALMFFLYNIINLGYWLSSLLAFIIGIIISYIFNRKYTFKNKEGYIETFIKFLILTLVCYFIAFGIAKKLVMFIISVYQLNLSITIAEQISMLFGQVIYTVINYIGQKKWVFKEKL